MATTARSRNSTPGGVAPGPMQIEARSAGVSGLLIAMSKVKLMFEAWTRIQLRSATSRHRATPGAWNRLGRARQRLEFHAIFCPGSGRWIQQAAGGRLLLQLQRAFRTSAHTALCLSFHPGRDYPFLETNVTSIVQCEDFRRCGRAARVPAA